MFTFVLHFYFFNYKQCIYIREKKGEYKMSNVTVQKRGNFYQYKFEIAKVDGKENL